MKRFRFRLETLRRLRVGREKLLRREYAEALAWLRAEDEILGRYKLEEANGIEELRDALSGSCKPRLLRLLEEYISGKAIDIEFQTERVEKARRAVDRKMEELVEASRDRKVVDRMRQRELDDHTYESNREEQRFLDEVAGAGFIMGGGGGRGEAT